MVSMSFGTSVVSNSVGDRAFVGVDKAVDHFCATDGKPINMVLLQNGTIFMNTVIDTFSDANGFKSIMPKLVEAPPDCRGLSALPFMDDEPGLNVSQGGTAMICGWNPYNTTAGNVANTALLSTIFFQGIARTGLPTNGNCTLGRLDKKTKVWTDCRGCIWYACGLVG
jgi:hypothetical protein